MPTKCIDQMPVPSASGAADPPVADEAVVAAAHALGKVEGDVRREGRHEDRQGDHQEVVARWEEWHDEADRIVISVSYRRT